MFPYFFLQAQEFDEICVVASACTKANATHAPTKVTLSRLQSWSLKLVAKGCSTYTRIIPKDHLYSRLTSHEVTTCPDGLSLILIRQWSKVLISIDELMLLLLLLQLLFIV